MKSASRAELQSLGLFSNSAHGVSAFTVRQSDQNMYAAYSHGDRTEIFRLSSEDGDVERYAEIPVGGITSMAFDRSNRLYAVTSSGSLYQTTEGGLETTRLGSTDHALTGLSFSPATGMLWATAHDSVYTVDVATGATALLLPREARDAPHSTITFSPLGTLYGLFGQWFVTIDKGTGDIQEIGLTGVSQTLHIGMSDVLTTADGIEEPTPRDWHLSPNYPNPFNPKTVITYQVPENSEVRLAVYDLLGREVATLVNERKASGNYAVTFDGSARASGMYVCRMMSGPFRQSRRMLLVR
jgi:hypothetical protein